MAKVLLRFECVTKNSNFEWTLIIIRYTNLLRYKAIMVPMTYYSTSKKTAVMTVILIWVLAFLIALPTAFFYQFTHIQDPSSGGLKVIFPASLDLGSGEKSTIY